MVGYIPKYSVILHRFRKGIEIVVIRSILFHISQNFQCACLEMATCKLQLKN